MHQFKNNEPVPFKRKKLYYGAIVFSIFLAVLHYLMYGFLNIENYVALVMSGFMIYCLRFGGAYRIARYIAERKIKKSDNDWDPKWIK